VRGAEFTVSETESADGVLLLFVSVGVQFTVNVRVPTASTLPIAGE